MRSKGRAALIACVPMFAALTLGAVSATPAFASGKPLAETKPATSVGEHEGTLNGVVNPNGAATKYYFEYWQNVLQVKKTAEVSAGSGTTNLEESATLTGLKAETVLYFRVVATNSNGTTDGAEATFETTGAPGLPEFAPIPKGGDHITFKTGEIRFETVSGTTYGCGSGSGEGTISGAKTATATLKLKSCGANGISCHSAGAEAGEIETASLPVRLVYLSKANHEAALVFNYHGSSIAKWSCGNTEGLGITGPIVVPITVNTSKTTFALKFAQTEKGHQNPSGYENAEAEKVTAYPTMALIGSFYEQGSLTGTVEFTAPEAIQVKA
jgi:hypothetical protein